MKVKGKQHTNLEANKKENGRTEKEMDKECMNKQVATYMRENSKTEIWTEREPSITQVEIDRKASSKTTKEMAKVLSGEWMVRYQVRTIIKIINLKADVELGMQMVR